MSKIPFFNRSTQDYSTPDVYSQNQQLTEAKDQYEKHQEDLQPKTYRERKIRAYTQNYFFKLVFPFFSAITLIGLGVFMSIDVETLLYGGLTLTQWVLGIVSFLGCCSLIIFNETTKTDCLDEIFRDKACGNQPQKSTIKKAIGTVIISAVGSCLGLFLITYTVTNKTPEYQKDHEGRTAGIESAYSTDTARINADYAVLIAAKQATIDSYHPTRYRTKRDQLAGEKNALINERDTKLKELKQGKQSDVTSSANTFTNLSESTNYDAWTAALITALSLLLLEGKNIFAHKFCWNYKSKVQNEGIEFGALQSKKEQNSYQIQLQRMSQYLETGLDVNTLQLTGEQKKSNPIKFPGQGESGTTSTAEMNRLKRELGELKKEQKKPILRGPFPKSKKELEELKKGDSEGVNSQGEKGESRGESSQGERGEYIHEKTKEIHLNNSHPKFSQKVQPDQYKGIDEKRYKKFVKVAQAVLDEKGKYVKAEIQRRTNYDKNTVNKYLKLAIEVRNDLTA